VRTSRHVTPSPPEPRTSNDQGKSGLMSRMYLDCVRVSGTRRTSYPQPACGDEDGKLRAVGVWRRSYINGSGTDGAARSGWGLAGNKYRISGSHEQCLEPYRLEIYWHSMTHGCLFVVWEGRLGKGMQLNNSSVKQKWTPTSDLSVLFIMSSSGAHFKSTLGR
jgi:hypothetical protein